MYAGYLAAYAGYACLAGYKYWLAMQAAFYAAWLTMLACLLL
jgi:hypothetical protein